MEKNPINVPKCQKTKPNISYAKYEKCFICYSRTKRKKLFLSDANKKSKD